jgi:SAM-dependent methyltransferase
MSITPEIRAHYEIERELADRLRRSNAEERKTLYGQVYDELTRRAPQQEMAVRSRDTAARVAFGQFQLGPLRAMLTPATHLLEIGAGDCALSLAAAPFVKHVLAIDVSDANVVVENPPANFLFKRFDGFTIPVADASVDLAYSRDVIEHLHPDDAMGHLREVHRVLKPGGKYVCITPNRLGGPWDISRYFDETPRGFHMREYTNDDLTSVFKQAGYTHTHIFLSSGARRLGPLMPVALASVFERLIEPLPRKARLPFASLLFAVKFVGEKSG